MNNRIKAEVVEGNGVWLCSRVTLPSGDYVKLANIPTSGTVVEVKLIRQTPVGASHLPQTLTQLTGVSGQTNLINVVFDTLQTTYWDGFDDLGYNFAYFLNPTGTDVDGNTYRLIGGNSYRVEILVQTNPPPTPGGSAANTVGPIRWAIDLYVSGLESL
ncbi:hypothetical protein [Limnobacter sp.]|uniref:hypothetical protein n=1 Tax=Limnobacter sp. TaxID=2003368 RepID=UPI0025C22CFB|nr:hypothetical protein [Limnobacter sp.]